MSLIPRKSHIMAPSFESGQNSKPKAGPSLLDTLLMQADIQTGPRKGQGLRVLLVHSGHLGDVVLALRSMLRTRLALPGAELALITTSPASTLIRAGGWFDQLWVLPEIRGKGHNPRNYYSWLKVIVKLMNFRPDLGLSYLPDPEDQFLLALSGAPWRIGALKEHNWIYNRAWLTSPIVLESLSSKRYQRFDAISDRVGFEPYPGTKLEDFPLPEAAEKKASELIQGSQKPLFVCLVCGSSVHRRWPLERYKKLLSFVKEHYDLNTILVSGPLEEKLLPEIQKEILEPGLAQGFHNQPLLSLVALLRRADLALSVDSGPGHLAAACGTEILYLLPQRKVRTFLPPGEHVTPLYSDRLQDISEESVQRQLDKLLKKIL